MIDNSQEGSYTCVVWHKQLFSLALWRLKELRLDSQALVYHPKELLRANKSISSIFLNPNCYLPQALYITNFLGKIKNITPSMCPLSVYRLSLSQVPYAQYLTTIEHVYNLWNVGCP